MGNSRSRSFLRARCNLTLAAASVNPPQAVVGPQVGVLYHVARVLLVAREAVRQRVGVGVRRPDQLIEGRPVTRLGGGDQIGQLECHTPLWTGTGRERLLPGA